MGSWGKAHHICANSCQPFFQQAQVAGSRSPGVCGQSMWVETGNLLHAVHTGGYTNPFPRQAHGGDPKLRYRVLRDCPMNACITNAAPFSLADAHGGDPKLRRQVLRVWPHVPVLRLPPPFPRWAHGGDPKLHHRVLRVWARVSPKPGTLIQTRAA